MLDSVELLRGSTAMLASDYEALASWLSSTLDWLRVNALAQAEENKLNNHATWYDALTARYAVFVGRSDLATELTERVKARRIATQIEPDGSQPEELSRTNSFHYSAYNLTAFFHLATLGRGLGVSLFEYETADGRGIRKALDFLAPYADPQKPWPYPQLTQDFRGDLLPLLRRAAVAYGEPSYEQILEGRYATLLAPNVVELVYPQ